LLSKDVDALLKSQVGSYEQLAILLRAHLDPDRTWSIQELSETLLVPMTLAENATRELHTSGLLMSVDGSPTRFRFAPNAGGSAAVARLAREYHENPIEVIKALSTNAIERLRTAAVRAFADAFVLKKKDRDSG
jgi:hypothetical protein